MQFEQCDRAGSKLLLNQRLNRIEYYDADADPNQLIHDLKSFPAFRS